MGQLAGNSERARWVILRKWKENGNLSVANFGHQAVQCTYYLFILFIGEFILSDNNRKALLLQILLYLS